MLNNKQFIALVGALVLAGGLISCNPDRNLSGGAELTGMLVHEPVFVRRDSTIVALSQFKKTETFNLDAKMKLAPVMNNGRGLSTLKVDSNCLAGTQPIGADSVTLPYSPSYSLVQFFTKKTLLNKVAPDATELTCSLNFTVFAVNGSTHSFSVNNLNIETENPDKTAVQILDEGLAASDYDGFIRMDFNHLNRYRIAASGFAYQSADFLCEINHAPFDKTWIENPLYGLRFQPRAGMQNPYSDIDKPEQFCRILFYRSDSTVAAVSNLILMTMAEPLFTVHRVPSAYPNQQQSHNIFDYSWRDYAVANHGSMTLSFAIPSGGTSTVDYENVYSQHPVDRPYMWAQVKLPTQIVVQAPTNSANGYQFFVVHPGQSVDVRIGVMPHDFVCDQWRVPIQYTVEIDSKEIPIYQIIDLEDPIDAAHVLHRDVIERRFVRTVTEDTFGSNEAYGNYCHRFMAIPNGSNTPRLMWGECALPFTQESAPVPMTPQNRFDGTCTKVD